MTSKQDKETEAAFLASEAEASKKRGIKSTVTEVQDAPAKRTDSTEKKDVNIGQGPNANAEQDAKAQAAAEKKSEAEREQAAKDQAAELLRRETGGQ